MKSALMSVTAFCRYSGIGKTSAYKLLKEGKLDSVKIGRRTLLTTDSINALIERSLVRKETV
jgi:excisionase family DNA binding protein